MHHNGGSKLYKDFANSGLEPVEKSADESVDESADESTDKSADESVQESTDLTNTRICREYKTGIPCTHPKCTFAHSFEKFRLH